jgi:hypothetical protein
MGVIGIFRIVETGGRKAVESGDFDNAPRTPQCIEIQRISGGRWINAGKNHH